MLVKALRLRYLGQRIPTDVLRQETPMFGELTYGPHIHGRATTAMLAPISGCCEPLIQLYACRIKIKKGGILIAGEKDHWKRKNRESYPQTLWAWPVPPEGMSIRVIQPSNLANDELRRSMR